MLCVVEHTHMCNWLMPTTFADAQHTIHHPSVYARSACGLCKRMLHYVYIRNSIETDEKETETKTIMALLRYNE